MKPWLIPTILSAFLGLLGWKIGSAGGTTSSTPVPAEIPAPPALAPPAGQRPQGGLPVSEAIDRIISAARNSGSSSQMILDLYEEAQHFETADLPAAIALTLHEGHAALAHLLAGYWAERDLEAAKKWMLGLDLENQSSAAAEIAGTWCRANPTEFLDWIAALPPDSRKRIAAASAWQIVSGAGVANPDRVAKLLLEQPDRQPQGNGSLVALFDQWTVTAPQIAAQKALAISLGGNRTDAVRAVAKAWARIDQNAAAAWVRGIGDAVLAGRATAAYAKGLAAKNPRAAAEFVGGLDATTENIETLNEIAIQWGARDSKAALAWADALTDEETQGKVLNRMLRAISLHDPAAAAREYARRPEKVSTGFMGSPLREITDDLFQQSGIKAVVEFADSLPASERWQVISKGVNTWASRDVNAASKWVLALPDEDRSDALAQVATYASKTGDAAQWALSLPVTPSSDDARLHVAMGNFNREEDRQRAMAIYAKVTDKDAVRGNLRRNAYWWMKSNPAQARPWIEAQTLLTPEDKASLFQNTK